MSGGQPAEASRHWIGVDLGGTNIRAALIADDGRILARVRRETRGADGLEPTLARIAAAIEEVRESEPSIAISGVGIGCPGPLDPRTGIVLRAPNLPGWIDVPLKAVLEGLVSMPVVVENDANAAALGESWLGAGEGASSLVLITLGTGIGGGIVLGGRIWRGALGFAGEIGHTMFVLDGHPCGCGNRGCLEQYASATGLVRRAREAIASGKRTSLGTRPAITAAVIHQEAKAGDALALDLLAETGRILGIAIGSIGNFLNPEVVILGGGLSNAGTLLFDPLRAEVRKHAFAEVAETLRIVPAALGDDAGVLGAARNAAIEMGEATGGA